ncbi:thymidylate synthase [Candidatus Woesebacteria bacterium RIFOXYC1_FULL_31_51]|uniref:Thymidylate synthase n=1 Tax=Candidatus Woesebacteria bacterium GW2011_GWC2_31_9 TaxID=1618586 RepID=A0A0G0B0E2_9BACT|nr:MAG: thymidylate synthase, thymidylate synthase [Candidatus Woesebacteria bacterium GW2011_GWF1_31_35]KKP22808.1 MAG: Thymidylate synthase [Candidatus Woesebacteria bacterium GW2011_GWC1_30_29]KKP26704.1 MAG: Thymidylate synthase [Candidatus Woesebacteria bacterium GW2011_GWD1_31_12]KKP28056.1 MAG: Thymidylate synthase [Candidatus Woesebacteria bacterium GW2011_GWB1_31_29]KKP32275.1 MAG: Thymidylate synthase [Candidatus Woesebacteria bacterium GW2011_GWC2_31_9]KKP32992.1 MAG: Thymidylate sy
MSTTKVNNHVDIQYQLLLKDILKNGTVSKDRTGTGTKKVFGRMLKFDLSAGFPLLTTKEVWFRGVKEELLWFIKGERNLRPLVTKGVNIWNEWPFQKYLEKNKLTKKYPKYSEIWKTKLNNFIEKIKIDEKFSQKWGDLGPVYGYQWRHWKDGKGKEIDQLKNAITLIKKNPDSRRIIVNAWNAANIENVALPPCHVLFQFQVVGQKLNLVMYQRSVDSFLGLPFNIASYALLTEIIANITDKVAGEVTMFLADTHLYLNHLKQAKEQIKRKPKKLPKLILKSTIKDINHISSDAITIEGYKPHPSIKAEISV